MFGRLLQEVMDIAELTIDADLGCFIGVFDQKLYSFKSTMTEVEVDT